MKLETFGEILIFRIGWAVGYAMGWLYRLARHLK
ncbi:hypothetical protein ES704_02054 [subsurface metagenome]|jgi:hypothetical protein